MGLGFPAQVFIPPNGGGGTWIDGPFDRQELVLDEGYGGFSAGVVETNDGELARYLMPSLAQAENFVRDRTPFVIEPDAWPIVFAPDVVRSYAGNSATVRLLVRRGTQELVGYLTFAKE